MNPPNEKNHSNISQMTGARKAAILLVALGTDHATEVIKFLPDKHTEKIMHEIAQIRGLKKEERDTILAEFFHDLSAQQFSQGGQDFASDLLTKAFGPEKARKILKKFASDDRTESIKRIEETDPSLLAALLAEEHPQILTFVLASISAKKSARLLPLLPAEKRNEIAKRLAKMETLSPRVVHDFLKKFIVKIDQAEDSYQGQKTGGIDSLIQILTHSNSRTERAILDSLDQENPDIAASIRSKLVTFEILLDLTNLEIRMVLDRITEDIVLVKALRGASEDIKRHILSNISRNRARTIMDGLDNIGPLPLSDIKAARETILQAAKRLDHEGYIILRKEGEEWVE